MANKILFISSVFHGTIHIVAILWLKAYTLLALLYIWAIITSLINHGLTGEFYKWLDRITILVAFIVNMTLTIMNINGLWVILVLNVLSACAYLMAK